MDLGCRNVEGPGDAPAPSRNRAAPSTDHKLGPEQQRLVIKYMPMARAWARPFRRHWFWTNEDFLSAAYLALVESAANFDSSRGITFGTFARLRIRGAMLDIQSRLRRMLKADGLQSSTTFDSWGESDDGPESVLGFEDPMTALIETADFVEQSLEHLPARHERTCREIYLNGRSQREAAELLGCSKSRISTLHEESLAWMRQSWETKLQSIERRARTVDV
ncbi:MAG: sigma-70 family RNA polymerase sigma factor [Isosphaeraceae bacterium]|nr:sigma-70 family RNA polymerase sigma factor [Isosphaeraceae bacterium]